MSDKIYIIKLSRNDNIHSAYTGKDGRKLAIERACGLLLDLDIYEFQSGLYNYNIVLRFDKGRDTIPETFNDEDRQIVENHPAIRAILEQSNTNSTSNLPNIAQLKEMVINILSSVELGVERELIDIGVHLRKDRKLPLSSIANLMDNLKGLSIDTIIRLYPNIRYALFCLQKTNKSAANILNYHIEELYNNHTNRIPFVLRIDDHIAYIKSNIDIDIFIDRIGIKATRELKETINRLANYAAIGKRLDWASYNYISNIRVRIINVASDFANLVKLD